MRSEAEVGFLIQFLFWIRAILGSACFGTSNEEYSYARVS